MKPISQRLSYLRTSVFDVIAGKARKHQAINLGQGFPDFPAPQWLLDLGVEVMSDGRFHQYAPFLGLPELREQIAQNYATYYGPCYQMENEIIITNGATEAIFSTILALIDKGDEVIVLEPFYDSYVSAILMAGGTPVPVTMGGDDFVIDSQELKEAFTPQTKLLIINNPHNPSGKVFSREELTTIAKLCLENDVYVLSDEVYEFLTFDKRQHLPMASLPQMQERTITISSIGKTFGVTGWKIGWACAHPDIIAAIGSVHQYNTFSVNTPCQRAAALALARLDVYLPEFRKLYGDKRDLFCQELKTLGWRPIIPQGTYFVLCPIDHLTQKKDIDFCIELIEDYKIASIPPSGFYLKSNAGEKYLRFCFAKKDETLLAAIEKIKNYPIER